MEESEKGNEKPEKKDGKKKKQITKTIDLPIEAITHGYSQTLLNEYQELEVNQIKEILFCIFIVLTFYLEIIKDFAPEIKYSVEHFFFISTA